MKLFKMDLFLCYINIKLKVVLQMNSILIKKKLNLKVLNLIIFIKNSQNFKVLFNKKLELLKFLLLNLKSIKKLKKSLKKSKNLLLQMFLLILCLIKISLKIYLNLDLNGQIKLKF